MQGWSISHVYNYVQVLKSMEKEEEQELDALKRRFTFNTWRLEKAMYVLSRCCVIAAKW